MNKKIVSVIIAVLVLAITAGGYAVYGANKDKKAEDSVDEAKTSAADLYKEMKKYISAGEESGEFKKIDGDKILTVEAKSAIAKADLENASENAKKELGKVLKEKVEPKIKEIQEYNKGATIAASLYGRINEAEKLAAENPLAPELLAGLPQLKEDTIEENSKFKTLEEPYSSLFTDRYVKRVEKLEGIINMFATAEQTVQAVVNMSVNEKTKREAFDKKVDEAKKMIDDLTNEAAREELSVQLENASTSFYTAVAEREEQARKKAEEEAKTFTAGDGTVYELGEGPDFEPEASVAKQHGGRLYYIPHSDVGIIVKDKATIMSMSAGSIGTTTAQAKLLADLLAAKGYKITYETIKGVVDTGTPFEDEKEFIRIYKQGNQLYAHIW
ncbi:hypothetical protein DRW41_09115 [Neobacillus piezotolerans]|uniref:Uncharacterized protein n=1 Tax=Neobacillus piezotolerans TaxID=2259171 RepID=A0A3D8GQT3_9BACI|nr:hypothetical protein [Neobacillus piezotolerans]RDU36855.1 hypothetical protein DRW41_09115 [Neobacillus piezotolerans]